VGPGWFILGISAAGAGAAAWLVYLRWKDSHRPEPWRLMLLTAVAGGAAVTAALLGYRVLDAVGASATWGALAGPWPAALATALAIGATEELAKLLPVLAVARWSRHFDQLWDGPVYAGAAGVGFALAETVSLFSFGETTLLETLARAATTPITHALFAAPWGLGLALWVLRDRPGALAVGLAVSIAAHAAYDLLLARPGTHLVAVGIVLVLWVGLIATGRRLSRIV
jgi:RsiW-degrading membrane proteinase PrsW (M82 family)